MATKKKVKKSPLKKKARLVPSESNKDKNSQKILIENFIALQRVMVDLSGKINDLTNQVSTLLTLFEESAKTLTEKDGKIGLGTDKEVSEKLNKLLDQNKVLAQGVALLHESNLNQQPPNQQPQPQQQMPNPNPNNYGQKTINKYQKSISSKY